MAKFLQFSSDFDEILHGGHYWRDTTKINRWDCWDMFKPLYSPSPPTPKPTINDKVWQFWPDFDETWP